MPGVAALLFWCAVSGFLYSAYYRLEVRPIVTDTTEYQDLVAMFGQDYPMPPESEYLKQEEVEYRCPYIERCPAGAKCFATAASEPLQQDSILNVKCRLINKKIPIYAAYAIRVRKAG